MKTIAIANQKGGWTIMKSSVLITIFLIIGFCSMANAECAWVLWQKAEITKTTWLIEGAFPSYVVCIQNEVSVCQGFASKSGDKCQSIEREGTLRFDEKKD